VSHIDGDHIGGLLALAGAQTPPVTPTLSVQTLWHNAFNDVVGDRAKELEVASAAGALDGTDHDLEAVVASIPEGRRLRILAKQLNWAVNRPIGKLITLDSSTSPLVITDGVTLQVVGPGREQISRLAGKWDKWLENATPKQLATAALEDRSVFNRSSIVLLLEAGGKRMLLTGDARGDDILAGLKRIGAIDNGVASFDLVKLPHHGSIRNVDEHFFATVRAKHYVISADGRFGNPDSATLDLLAQSRTDDDFTLHITNHEGLAGTGLAARLDAWIAAQGRAVTVVLREDPALSVRVDLLEPLPY
jgi:hypothetical protein